MYIYLKKLKKCKVEPRKNVGVCRIKRIEKYIIRIPDVVEYVKMNALRHVWRSCARRRKGRCYTCADDWDVKRCYVHASNTASNAVASVMLHIASFGSIWPASRLHPRDCVCASQMRAAAVGRGVVIATA